MRFSKIKNNDIANGIGITMSLWTQGCPHHCKGCFNEETWDFAGGKLFGEEDLQYILSNIDNFGIERNFAVLGGEPLAPSNVEGVIEVCRAVRERFPSKRIYVWTGYRIEDFNEIQLQILSYIDMLIDGPFDINKRNLSIMLRGSSNQRIIDVGSTLQKKKLVLSSLNNE